MLINSSVTVHLCYPTLHRFRENLDENRLGLPTLPIPAAALIL